MERPVDTDEIERELRATIAARREVGPEYEDHLIEAFLLKMQQQALVKAPPVATPRPPRGASAGQRLALGVVSVGALIPLSAITLAISGFPAFLVVTLVVLGINVAVNAVN